MLRFEGREQILALADALSGQYTFDIVEVMTNQPWWLSSEIARALEIHTTTATKYLEKLHQLGVVQRRTRHGRKRAAYEYQLIESKLSIRIDIHPNGTDSGEKKNGLPQGIEDVSKESIQRIIKRALRLAGPACEVSLQPLFPGVDICLHGVTGRRDGPRAGPHDSRTRRRPDQDQFHQRGFAPPYDPLPRFSFRGNGWGSARSVREPGNGALRLLWGTGEQGTRARRLDGSDGRSSAGCVMQGAAAEGPGVLKGIREDVHDRRWR